MYIYIIATISKQTAEHSADTKIGEKYGILHIFAKILYHRANSLYI